MLKKALFVGVALMSLAATTTITPVEDYTHQVVIEYDDGGPPITRPDGTLKKTMEFRAGPYKAENCPAALKSLLGWFKSAEEQINVGRKDEHQAKLVSSRCERIAP